MDIKWQKTIKVINLPQQIAENREIVVDGGGQGYDGASTTLKTEEYIQYMLY